MGISRVRRRLATAAATVALSAATVFVAPTPAQAATYCVDYEYAYGGYSTCIKYIQTLLNFFKIPVDSKQRGVPGPTPYVNLVVDGSFGPKTRAAVYGFQGYWGLLYDGRVGPQTWRWLCSPQMGGPSGPPPSWPAAAANSAGCWSLWD